MKVKTVAGIWGYACALAFVVHLSALGQEHPFNSAGTEASQIPGHKCTGFPMTPSWKCEPISIPIYLRRANDSKALVMISHGSQGLDKRHSDYAKQLTENGINAVVIGHWEARGLGAIQSNYNAALEKGGNSPNQVLDVLIVGTHFAETPQWADTKFGHIGESMGGSTSMNLTRPYLRRAYSSLYKKEPIKFSALSALYAGCTDRNTVEVFLPFPLLFLHGTDDDDTLARDCERQVHWINERGGSAKIILLKGEHHDFDAPYRAARWRVENPAKCANLRDGDTFTLEVNGAKYPGTVEGMAQMRKDCIGMTRTGVMSGNNGNPKTGYTEWTKFFKENLIK